MKNNNHFSKHPVSFIHLFKLGIGILFVKKTEEKFKSVGKINKKKNMPVLTTKFKWMSIKYKLTRY